MATTISASDAMAKTGAATNARSGRCLPPTEEGLTAGERILVLGGGPLASLALMAISSVLPLIQIALAHGPGDAFLVKQFMGVVGLAMVVGASLAGFLVDRIGLRRMLVACGIVYAAFGTTGLYLSSLPALLLCRAFLGVAAAAIQICAITLINTRLDGAERAKWMGLHISAALICTIVAHPVAGFLGTISWRLPFGFYALGLLICFVRVPDMRVRGQDAAAGVADAVPLRAWFPFRFMAFALMIGSIVYLSNVYAPFLARARGVSSPAAIALVLMVDSILGALLAMLYGRARRRFSMVALFLFSFSCTGIGMLVAALPTGFAGVVIGLTIFGLGIAWTIPNLMTALSFQVGPERQGRAAGLVKASHFLAAPVAVTLVEPLTRAVGPVGAMWAGLGLSLVCMAMVLFGRDLLVEPDGGASVPVGATLH